MPGAEPLSILHADADLVAIDKPAGLLVHPSALDAHEERSALHLHNAKRGCFSCRVERVGAMA